MSYLKKKLKKIVSYISCTAFMFALFSGINISAKTTAFEDTVADFSGIYITRKRVSLKTGGSVILNVREINSGSGNLMWESSDSSIAEVAESGLVTAVGTGEVEITVTKGNYQDTCTIVVTDEDPMIEEYAHLMELKRDFLDLRFGMFIHFNSATYEFRSSGGDWGGEGYVSTFQPQSWNPNQLDCAQWAKAAKSAGMTFAVLTTKHHDGFNLWDSAYTEYDVGSGKDTTDVVAEFVTACREEGIQPGLYFSMLDLKHNITSTNCTPSDVEFIKAQLGELLTNYGKIPFLIMDGWNADWGGPSYEDLPYEEIVDYVRSIQPDCLVINISCEVNDTHSDIIMFENAAGQEVPEWFSNVSVACHTLTPCWFWMDSYTSVDLRTTNWAVNQKYVHLKETDTVFILNVSPNPKGKLIDKYITRLEEIGRASQKNADVEGIPESCYVDYDYKENLLFRKTAAQSSTEGRAAAARAVDGYTDYEFDHATASRTQGQQSPWWQGDIGYSTELETIKIFAGEGASTLRKTGRVFISENPISENATWDELTNDNAVVSFSIGKAECKEDCFAIPLNGISGRYIRIMLEGTGTLTLSEVIVNPKSDGEEKETVTDVRTTVSSQTVLEGTSFDQLKLPDTVQLITDKGSLLTGNVKWEKETYQAENQGTYTIYGTIDGQDTDVKAKATVIVKKQQDYQEVPIISVNASSWWGQPVTEGDARPVNIINHSGLTIDEENILLSTHDNPHNASSMWHSEDGFQTGTLIFDFGSVKKVDNVLIWNHNQLNCSNRGVKTAEFYYTQSATPSDEDWIKIGTYTLNKASESANLLATDFLYLGEISARKIKIEAVENYGGSNIGLSEVIFLENTRTYANDLNADKLATAISNFEYFAQFNYPAEDYGKVQNIYVQALEALSGQTTQAELDSLTSQLEEGMSDLRAKYIEREITNLGAMYFEVPVGTAVMPENILVTFSDGTSENLPVTWYTDISSLFVQPDTFSVQGRLTGTPYSFVASAAIRGVSSKALASYVEDYEKLDLSGYSTESAERFSAALAEAKAVLSKENATQEEIDSAKDTLKTAKYQLVKASNGNSTVEKKSQYDTLIKILLVVMVVVILCCAGLIIVKKVIKK